MQTQPLKTNATETSWLSADLQIIDLTVRFDSITAPVIERSINLLQTSGVQDFILDATNTTFMTGMGLRCILAAARMVQQAKGRLAICNLSGQPKAMFDTFGYDNFIPVFGQRQDALDAFADS